jgi:hypothetical protein
VWKDAKSAICEGSRRELLYERRLPRLSDIHRPRSESVHLHRNRVSGIIIHGWTSTVILSKLCFMERKTHFEIGSVNSSTLFFGSWCGPTPQRNKGRIFPEGEVPRFANSYSWQQNFRLIQTEYFDLSATLRSKKIAAQFSDWQFAMLSVTAAHPLGLMGRGADDDSYNASRSIQSLR